MSTGRNGRENSHRTYNSIFRLLHRLASRTTTSHVRKLQVTLTNWRQLGSIIPIPKTTQGFPPIHLLKTISPLLQQFDLDMPPSTAWLSEHYPPFSDASDTILDVVSCLPTTVKRRSCRTSVIAKDLLTAQQPVTLQATARTTNRLRPFSKLPSEV